jgi:hypothetical protein
MSKQLNRKTLMVNQRRGIKQHFNYTPDFSPKSVAEPSIVSWAHRGRGVQGETVNSSSTNDKFIVNKNRKPL